MANKESKAIFYSINDNKNYYLFLQKSISSLRSFNKEISVFLFHFGKINDEIKNFCISNNISIIEENPVKDEYLTSIKWNSLNKLQEFKYNSYLFVDADTIFFENPIKLFNSCNEKDFYARQEAGTEKNTNNYLIGSTLIKPILNHEIYLEIFKLFNSNELPVFNTGVMLFNNNLVNKFNYYLELYNFILESFLNNKLIYPSTNKHVIDEIVSSICLGKIQDFSYDFLDKNLSPWYIEFKESKFSKKGIVMHIWTSQYKSFLLEYLK